MYDLDGQTMMNDPIWTIPEDFYLSDSEMDPDGFENKWLSQFDQLQSLVASSWEKWYCIEAVRQDLHFQKALVKLRRDQLSLSLPLPFTITNPADYDTILATVERGNGFCSFCEFLLISVDYDEENPLTELEEQIIINRLRRLRDFLRTGDLLTNTRTEFFVYQVEQRIKLLCPYKMQTDTFFPPELYDFVVYNQLFTTEAYRKKYYPQRPINIKGYTRIIDGLVQIYYFYSNTSVLVTKTDDKSRTFKYRKAIWGPLPIAYQEIGLDVSLAWGADPSNIRRIGRPKSTDQIPFRWDVAKRRYALKLEALKETKKLDQSDSDD